MSEKTGKYSMSDTVPQSDRNITVKLPKADCPEWATSLTKSFNSAFGGLRIDMDLLLEDRRELRLIVAGLQERLDGIDGRLMRTSSRVKEPSSHDLAAQAELANERLLREELGKKVDALAVNDAHQNIELAKQTAILQDAMTALSSLSVGASKLIANPMFRAIVTALGAAILTWLGSKVGK